ncbi:uncharacterized protein B0T23DRAFT_64621 [Neurospora hispaniola]|uniref:Uncharacterized protein n=1 Tax=Neurospora hispaniola TaxID=588809 RepID=A0AAJ0MTA7_9PEZI|nr:hypothetical protein B0T23DRAFT_64621 [Neurospora hispaniola]
MGLGRQDFPPQTNHCRGRSKDQLFTTPFSIKSNKHREYRHWAVKLQRESITVMRLSGDFVIGGIRDTRPAWLSKSALEVLRTVFFFFFFFVLIMTCICYDCAHESGENRIVPRKSRQVRHGHSSRIYFRRRLSLLRQRCGEVEVFDDFNHVVATSDPRKLSLWLKIGGMAF